VRSYDRSHTLSLRARGVEYEARETFESGMCSDAETLEALGTSEDQALSISDDIRHRDEERLAIQAVEGMLAGREKLHTKPVSPEPLMKPKRKSERLDGQSQDDYTVTIRPDPFPAAAAEWHQTHRPASGQSRQTGYLPLGLSFRSFGDPIRHDALSPCIPHSRHRGNPPFLRRGARLPDGAFHRDVDRFRPLRTPDVRPCPAGRGHSPASANGRRAFGADPAFRRRAADG
jgi:hypothetical protein